MLVLLLLLTAGAQEEDLLGATLRANVRAGETDVHVELRYELVVPDESEPVSLRILEVGGTRVENLSVNGVERALDRTAAPRLTAEAVAPGGVMDLAYDVRGAVNEVGVRLPVVIVGIAQKEARPDTFRDEVILPPELSELGLARFPPGDSLPVVPAFVAFGPLEPPLTEVPSAGFIFWGVFFVFGLVVAAYLVWMRRTERSEPEP